MTKKKTTHQSGTPFRDALRAGDGFLLAESDPRATPAFSGGKSAGKAALEADENELATLQEKLFASGRSGGSRRVLLVLQGMDTAGKGGILRHVIGSVDPQGVHIKAFEAPTEEERSHPFLWRIRQALPPAGMIGVFDRSHYEDVLVARVRGLVAPPVWRRRYDAINRFERTIVADDTVLLKVMLDISRDEQKARFTKRLDRPDKHWKYNPGDLDDRERWDDYREAYQAVLDRCSTDEAPWFVVPGDRKWYARLAVQQLLLEHLRPMDLTWPSADFDVEAEEVRLAAS